MSVNNLANVAYSILPRNNPDGIDFECIRMSVVDAATFLQRRTGLEYTEEIQMEACRLIHQWLGTVSVMPGAIIDDGTVSEWVDTVETDWFYWNRYKKMLLEGKHWSETVVNKMDEETSEILRRLGNPSENEFSKKGLVIGHVQAGKTANYTALINKAVDVGYRVIIVIAGTLESLRSQTQKRIEHDMVGRVSARTKTRTKDRSAGVVANHGPFGVARFGYDEKHMPMLITYAQTDFNINDTRRAGYYNPSQPLVLVIKKNVNVLNAVEAWFRERFSPAERANLPMLLIDDEADNATINTATDPENTPTAINAAIRRLISKRLFRRCSYVGYTATPYANIFIDPESYNAAVQDDLFPRDFICCLSTPDSYMGPSKFFLRSRLDENEDGEESDLLPYVRTIPSADTNEDSLLPVNHKRDFVFTDLPDSLKEAVMTFIIAKSIRLLRFERHKHCGMLIHVSRFTAVQNTVADVVQSYFDKCKNEVDEYAATPYWKDSKLLLELEHVWKKQYEGCLEGDTVITWEKIRFVLSQAMESVQFRCINVNTPPEMRLNYDLYENGLTAIVVGGMSMARGITVEGLVCSYFVRNTKMYDTLMQMGRWFGHRQGYADLCRVFMRRDTQEWFTHIAAATEELRDAIMKMQEGGATPMEFGLRVRSDTTGDRLLITARNRMRNAHLIHEPDTISFEGELFETSKLPVLNDALQAGCNRLTRFIEHMIEQYGKPVLDEQNRGWLWRNIPQSVIIEYLQGSEELKKTCASSIYTEQAIIDYITRNDECFDVVLLSVNGAGADVHDKQRIQVGGVEVIMPYRSPELYDIRADFVQFRKSHFFSARDESAGLTDDVVQSIRLRYKKQGCSVPGHAYRNVEGRNPLLMMSYALLLDADHIAEVQHRRERKEPRMTPTTDPDKYTTVASVFGISWTGAWQSGGARRRGVPYMVNQVYLNNLNAQINNAENANDDEDVD